MLRFIAFAAVAVFGTVLAAQLTPGLRVNTVIHEPSAGEVGPFIAAQGDFGNGKGLKHVDSVSGEFYALANTTTHDLCILTNNTGADIIVDLDYTTPSPGALILTNSRAAVNPPNAPQQNLPDPGAQLNILGADGAAVSIPNGSSVAVFLLVTRWGPRLITSPRDYFLEFTFTDIATGAIMSFEAKMTVPHKNNEEPSCTVRNNRFPGGLLLIAGGSMAAMATRRRMLTAKA